MGSRKRGTILVGKRGKIEKGWDGGEGEKVYTYNEQENGV